MSQGIVMSPFLRKGKNVAITFLLPNLFAPGHCQGYEYVAPMGLGHVSQVDF